ncbi:MAG: hypothetical protein J1F35_04710 [Erysipelotrichales bacterium]|nr:hypothetical protein [Erysipelotrichales bacterium]
MAEVKVKVKQFFNNQISKYNVNCESLYKVLEQYPKDIVNIVMVFYKRGDNKSYYLLTRMYGPAFDGEAAKRDLSYSEKNELESLFKRMELFLNYTVKQIEKGAKPEDLKKIFRKASDEEILELLKEDTVADVNTVIFDLDNFMKTNNLTEDTLSNILDFHDNSAERIAYKRKHGINCSKMKAEDICHTLFIDNNILKRYIKNVEKNLPNLLNKAKEVEDSLKVLGYNEEVKKTDKHIKPTEDKKTENNPTHESQASAEPIKKDKTGKIIGNNRPNKRFVYFFATTDMTEDEIKKLEDKVIEIAFLLKDVWKTAFDTMRKYFGDDLRGTFTGSMDPEDFGRYSGLKDKIRELQHLEMEDIIKSFYEAGEEKTKEVVIGNKGPVKKFVFFFAPIGMDEENVKELEDKVIKIAFLLKDTYKQSFELMVNCFGSDLRGCYLGTFTNKDYNRYKGLIHKIKELKVLDLDEIEIKLEQEKEAKEKRRREAPQKPLDPDKLIGNRGPIKKFVNLFATNGMSEKEKAEILDEAVEMAFYLRDHKGKKIGFNAAAHFFGEDLRQEYVGKLDTKIYPAANNFAYEVNCHIHWKKKSEQEKVERLHNYEVKLEYLDSLIHFETTINKKSPLDIAHELDVPIHIVLMSLINNITHYDIASIIKYIVTRRQEYIETLLNSDYFKPLMDELTLIEKNLIYLKLLSVSNKDITDEYISNMLGITIEDIESYEIYSDDEAKKLLSLYLK